MKKKIALILRIISKTILTLLLILIVLLAAYVVYIKVMQKQDKLDKVPFNMYVILTQSMSPKIKAGDMIITFKTKDDVYAIGDVVTYISDGTYTQGITVTHRIVKITLRDGETAYVTKGDANNTEDSPAVLTKNIMGKVILKIPKIGYIQQFLATKFGWLVAIVVPCMGIIIFDFVKIFTRRKKLLERKRNLQETTNIDNVKTITTPVEVEHKEPEKKVIIEEKRIEKREEDAKEDFWGIN